MPQTRDLPGQLRLACCPEEGEELRRLAAARRRYRRDKESNPVTLRTEQKVFRILEALGVRTIADLMAEDLDPRFTEYCAGTRWAATTRDTLRGTLHSIVRFAHERSDWPASLRLPPRIKPGSRRWRQEHPPTTRHRPPPPAVVARLLEHLEDGYDTWTGLRLRALVILMVEIRIKLAAALRLKPADVDPAFLHRILYSPRGGRQRGAATTRRLERALDGWLPHCGEFWLFPADRSGLTPWTQRAAKEALKAVCRAAGIEPVTFEQLYRYADPAAAGEARAFDAAGVELDALADEILRRWPRKLDQSRLVRVMKGRDFLPRERVIAEVYDDRENTDSAIKMLVQRTNATLHELGSPLGFATRDAGIIREDRPAKTGP